MGWGWSKNSGLENRKLSEPQRNSQRLITQNENAAQPVVEVSVSINSDKQDTGKQVEKDERSKKKKKEK